MIDYTEIKKQLESRINDLQLQINDLQSAIDRSMADRNWKSFRTLIKQCSELNNEVSRIESVIGLF